jgi:hypothetical protein
MLGKEGRGASLSPSLHPSQPMSNDDPPDCSAMKAAYYAKVIRGIAFQLKVSDAVPPFFTVPPPPDGRSGI